MHRCRAVTRRYGRDDRRLTVIVIVVVVNLLDPILNHPPQTSQHIRPQVDASLLGFATVQSVLVIGVLLLTACS